MEKTTVEEETPQLYDDGVHSFFNWSASDSALDGNSCCCCFNGELSLKYLRMPIPSAEEKMRIAPTTV